VCCDGAKISQRVYCGREDGVMGSLEARGVAEGDRTSFWQAIIVDLFSGGTAWWDSSCRAASLQAGIDARGARGDFRGITARQSARSMAKLLGRSPSTISREMSRNGGYDRYRATLADEKAWARARRPKYCKLATNLRLRQAVKAAGACGLAGLELRRDLLGRVHLESPEHYLRDMRCGLELLVREGRVRRARIQEPATELVHDP
jgi:hypothetical protein